jgi:hypothetical protein
MRVRKHFIYAAAIVGLFVYPAATASAAIIDGLVLHSTLDTASITGPINTPGTVVHDLAGPTFQNGSVLNTGLTTGTGLMGQAIKFPGLANTHSVTYGDILDVGTGEYSVSLWFNTSDFNATGANQFLASRGANGSADPGWHFSANTNGSLSIRMNATGAARMLSKGGLLISTWNHVVLTLGQELDGTGTITAYVNGSTAGFTSPNGFAIPAGYNIIANDAHELFLGRRGTTTTPSNALLDDFAIWNRALSPSEVSLIYSSGLQGLNVQQIPEPNSMVLSVLGGLAAIGFRRRSK